MHRMCVTVDGTPVKISDLENSVMEIMMNSLLKTPCTTCARLSSVRSIAVY